MKQCLTAACLTGKRGLVCECCVCPQENGDQAGALSFWMANASELLHFLKQDVDISRFTVDAQDILAEAVQVAFRSVATPVKGPATRWLEKEPGPQRVPVSRSCSWVSSHTVSSAFRCVGGFGIPLW